MGTRTAAKKAERGALRLVREAGKGKGKGGPVKGALPAVLMGLRPHAGGFVAKIFCPVDRITQSCELDVLDLRRVQCPECPARHDLISLKEALDRDLFMEGDLVEVTVETLWAWRDGVPDQRNAG